MEDKKVIIAASVDIGDNITQLLGKLADKIGTTADQVYPWYVKQQVLEGWGHLLTFSLIFIIAIPTFLYSVKKADFQRENIACFLTIIFGIITLIASIIFAIELTSIITDIFNPNLGAFKSLTRDMSRLVK